MQEVVDKWYQECREEGRKEASAGRREARVGTGYSASLSKEETKMLNAVVLKLRSVDKLRARWTIVKSDWLSDDTGEDFVKELAVFIIRW